MTPWRASLLAAGLACGAAGALGGCGSATRYQAADSRVPAAWLLNAPFPPAPVSATLATVIVCGGPGSWKREALWDEYIVTLKNPGAKPVTVTAVELEDFSGGRGAAAVDPWKLEHESAERARMFQRTGVAFAREALPVGLGAGLAAGYSGYAAAAGRIVPTVFVDGEAARSRFPLRPASRSCRCSWPNGCSRTARIARTSRRSFGCDGWRCPSRWRRGRRGRGVGFFRWGRIRAR
jgi:hypothetical protein